MPRSLAASLTGLFAAVLLPLGILSVWVDGVVSDTDTYVDTVTPLADDDAVKAAAIKELQREALQAVAESGVSLGPGGGQQLVGLVVRNVVNSPAFRTVWVEANRAAHEQVVAVLERRGDAHLDDQGRVSIDLGAALESVVSQLTIKGFPAPDTSGIDASFAVMDADQLAKARRAYDALDTLGFWLPVGWLVAVALTLLLARRRLAGTASLAAASAVALGGLALALAFAREAVTEDLPQRDVALAVWDVVVAGLWREIEVAGAIAVAVAVVAWLVSRLWRPSGPGPDDEAAYA